MRNPWILSLVILICLFTMANPCLASLKLPRELAEDVAEQFRPLPSGNGYLWYLQYARAEDVKATLEQVFFTEVSGSSLAVHVSAPDNALIIRLTGDDTTRLFRDTLGMIRRVDIRPEQVLIDILIAQVDMNHGNTRGLEWRYLSNNTFNQPGLSFDSSVEHSQLLTTSASVQDLDNQELQGFKFILDNTERIRTFLQGLKSNDAVDVISSPHLIAMNNKEASFNISTYLPIRYRTINGQTSSGEIQYDTSGVSLQVIPRINQGNLITLDILQTVDEVEAYDSGEQQATTTKRVLETSLTLREYQTVILGGFIKRDEHMEKENIPGIHRLPLIGRLFSWERKVVTNSEVVIFVTPRIIKNRRDADDVSDLLLERTDLEDKISGDLSRMEQKQARRDEFIAMLIPQASENWQCTSPERDIAKLINHPPVTLTSRLENRLCRGKSIPVVTPAGYGAESMAGRRLLTRLKPRKGYVFFREFPVTDPARFGQLMLKVSSDNAALVYLNGRLVDADPATLTQSGHDAEFWNRRVILPPSLLQKGSNRIIAIMRNEKNSRETLFDLELEGMKEDPGAPGLRASYIEGEVSK